MSLWDKTEYDAIAGTFAGTEGETVLTYTGAVDLTTVLRKGDLITSENDGSGANIVVLEVTEDTVTVAELEADVAGTLYRKDVPSFVTDPEYAATLSIVTTEEASNADFKAVGLKTPGWNRSITYTDQNGKVRTKSETLAVFRSNT